jgi:WD40 repeat protein
MWDMSVWGQAEQARRAVLQGHTDRVTCVAISPAGNWLASAADDGKVRIWDCRTYRCRATIVAGQVSRLALLDDGTLVTAGGADVRTWDLAGRRVRATLACDHAGDRRPAVTVMAVSPCQSWMAIGDTAGAVRIWDIASGALRSTMHDSSAEVPAITIAPDGGRLAASCDDGTLRIWQMSTHDIGALFVGHAATKVYWTPPVGAQDYRAGKGGKDTVWGVAIAPDATWLVTAESDRVTRIWDTSTGDVCVTLRVRGKAFDKKAATLAVAIAPDGCWLATGDSEGIVRIWDVARSS